LSNRTEPTRRFIREALPLVSSFLYSEQVELESENVPAAQDPDEYQQFAKTLTFRHALACGFLLRPILAAIERGVSHASRTVRTDTKGVIRGQLDIPLYLNRRMSNLSWPRTFPVLITKESPGTPENQLTVCALRGLARRLRASEMPEGTAERVHSRALLRWTREKLHAAPWSEVLPARSISLLQRETEYRVRKRQTGNDVAYSRLINWFAHWNYDASKVEPDQFTDLTDLFLAFPPGEFFEDRVFEIWCLQQVLDAFVRCGAIVQDGPCPLSQRGRRAIAKLSYREHDIEIWFQRAFSPELAKWRYLDTGKPLAGIPDITVTANGRRLIIDAKRREVVTNTRSEETYKMLGYCENYHALFPAGTFRAALCFLSPNELFTELVTDDGDNVVMVGAHPHDPAVCAFGGRIDAVLTQWLDHVMPRHITIQ